MTKLAIVIVLYKTIYSESKTFITLREAINNVSEDEYSFEILLYDNSPLSQIFEENNSNIYSYSYIHDPDNGGLVSAYNMVLNLANKHNISWIMLLDQDSWLPVNYFEELSKTLERIEYDNEVVAIIPKVVDESTKSNIISPARIWPGRIIRPYTIKTLGCVHENVAVINSGSVIRSSFLNNIGGFNKLFKLDCLDDWLFHTIQLNKKKIYLMDATIKHNLSVSNYNYYMTIERYESILHAEALFFRLFASKLDRGLYPFILIIRTIKQLLFLNNKAYAKMTAYHIFHRY